jgi:hypothetical protein
MPNERVDSQRLIQLDTALRRNGGDIRAWMAHSNWRSSHVSFRNCGGDSGGIADPRALPIRRIIWSRGDSIPWL